MCSGSGNSCYSAIDWALQGSQKYELLAAKMCSWIDLIALIRAQTTLDIASNLSALSANTTALVTQLIDQFDAEPSFYTNGTDAADDPSTAAADAQEFGVTTELNSNLVNVLVRTCNFDNGGRVRLGTYNAITLNSGDDNDLNNHTQFLFCISDHLRQLQVFLERTARAKNCESPC